MMEGSPSETLGYGDEPLQSERTREEEVALPQDTGASPAGVETAVKTAGESSAELNCDDEPAQGDVYVQEPERVLQERRAKTASNERRRGKRDHRQRPCSRLSP